MSGAAKGALRAYPNPERRPLSRRHKTMTCEAGGLRHVVYHWTTSRVTALCKVDARYVQVYDGTNFVTCLWCAAGKCRKP